MTKQKILSIFLSASIILSPATIFAENQTQSKSDDGSFENNDSVRMRMFQVRHDKMMQEMRDNRDGWQQAKDRWQSARSDDKITARKDLGKAFSERLHFITNGLQNLHDRIDKWTDKMVSEKGIDGSKAKEDLASAQTKIDLIKSKIDQIKATLEADIAEKDKEAKKTEIKNTMEEIRGLIKDAHDLLKQAFGDIKTQIKDSKDNTEADN